VGPVSGPVIDYKEMEEPPPSSWEYDPVSQVEIVESGPRAVPVPLRSLPAVKAETKPFTDELPPESRPAQEPIEPLPPSSGTPDLRSLTIKYGESEEDEKEENGPPSWYARLQQQPSISSMLPGHLTEPPHPAALSTSPVTADEGELAKPDTEARGTSAAPAEAPTALRRVARMALPFVAGAGLVLGGYSLSSLRSRQEPGAQNEAPAAPPSLEKVRASETPPVSTTVETSPSVAASAPAMASASSAGRPSDQKVATESRPGDKPRPTDSPSAAAKPAAPASAEKPAEAAPAPEAQKTGPDTTAVKAALSQGATLAQACRKEGEPPGSGVVQVTFAPSGRVTRAIMQGPPFGGTATGSCIANKLRSLSIPPYSGDPVTVSKTITLQ
jgi:hypothetical protein